MSKLKLLLISAAIGLLGTFLFNGVTDDEELQKDIAEKILRFHVIANSNLDEDQALKLKVKDAVVDYIAPYLTETMSLDETKSVINSHKDNILAVANNVVRENGYDYNVTASITTCYFPIKSYGDITLPAGDYEAFRIEIGEASGKNWWCILYPPLCFVDVSYGIVPDSSKLLLQNILDEQEYNAITEASDTEYSFRFLTFLKSLFR
ncbi:MAG: stage II sporulation protein R [Lachnospiraceae bacterium]